jgi:hypothetical protein
MANIINKISKESGQKKKLWLDAALPPLPLQHVWYEMKQQREWKSIALLPITDDIKTLGVAHSMGLMAVREPHNAIWVVNATGESPNGESPPDIDEDDTKNPSFPYKFVDLTSLGVTREKQLFTAERLLAEFSEEESESMRFIFAVDSVLQRTHAISLCRTVDAVILCVALGHTSFKEVRRTIEIVGTSRIMGTVVIKPKSGIQKNTPKKNRRRRPPNKKKRRD